MDTRAILHIVLQPFTGILEFSSLVCEIKTFLPINPCWVKKYLSWVQFVDPQCLGMRACAQACVLDHSKNLNCLVLWFSARGHWSWMPPAVDLTHICVSSQYSMSSMFDSLGLLNQHVVSLDGTKGFVVVVVSLDAMVCDTPNSRVCVCTVRPFIWVILNEASRWCILGLLSRVAN